MTLQVAEEESEAHTKRKRGDLLSRREESSESAFPAGKYVNGVRQSHVPSLLYLLMRSNASESI